MAGRTLKEVLAAEEQTAKRERGSRPVFFAGAFRETPVYQRASLAAGFRLDGPAVVEEFGSTTVVFPGQQLEVDAHGILIVRPARQAPEAVR